jgi:hypothetical protein
MTAVATPDAVLIALVEFARAYRRMTGRTNRAGAPADTGLTVDQLVARAAALFEPGGVAPTADAVAEDIGLTVRWIRRVASRGGGWHAITARAASELSSGSRPPAARADGPRSRHAG